MRTSTRYFSYLLYVLRHKWYVFVECCRLGIPLRGIVHDLSKFSRIEFGSYARQFYGPGDKEGFARAWALHKARNPHHWEFWVSGTGSPQRMPESYAKEMLADWQGAGKAQGRPDVKGWYEKHRDQMILHPVTRAWIERRLGL